MVQYCCFGCQEKYVKGGVVTFHSFPKDEARKKLWVQKLRRVNFTPTKFSKVCSKHFEEHCFDREKFGGVWLKTDAVPTIFNFPKHLINQSTRRKSPLKRASYVVVNSESRAVAASSVPCTEVSANDENSLSSNEGVSRSRKRPFRYIGDFNEEDMNSPVNARKVLEIAQKQISMQKKILHLQTENKKCKRKISSLESLLMEIKQQAQMSDDALHVLETSLPGPSKELVKRAVFDDKGQYPSDLRTFALTLQFYSSKAYNYVRENFNSALPHVSTLRKWYAVESGLPGTTRGALIALKAKAEEAKTVGKSVFCGLIVDEMALRQHVEWDGNKFSGYIDYGTGLDNDQLPVAKDAWVLMINSINDHWKLPIGYFLINGLGASERANFITLALHYLSETGVNVVSLTFDGTSSNLAMARSLGANLDPNSDTFCPFFNLGSLDMKIYIILDACHMIKLVRNLLATKGVLLDPEGKCINWKYIKNLAEVQEEEGLVAATKLRARHVQWKREKMKVKLASQTLSKSVAEALRYMEHDLGHPSFVGADATANFALIFDGIFDVLNSKNLLSKGKKAPLRPENAGDMFNFLKSAEEYMRGLCLENRIPVLQSNRKTGLMGFIVTIRSVMELYGHLVGKGMLKFLLTYKLSQDHLEMFFSCVRSKGGFNNNPTAKQFAGAYKRLLVHHQVSSSAFANCVPQDETTILNASSRQYASDLEVLDHQMYNDVPNDHLYLPSAYNLENRLSPYVVDIVTYIGGFVVKNLQMSITCKECKQVLSGNNIDEGPYSFIQRKDKNGLCYPSADVIKICKRAEVEVRVIQGREDIYKKAAHVSIVNRCLREFVYSSIFSTLTEHIIGQEAVMNHRHFLIKLILIKYIEIRFKHIGREQSQMYQNNTIRSINNKLVLFKGQ